MRKKPQIFARASLHGPEVGEDRQDSRALFQFGRLPYSYTGLKQELQRAADVSALGHLRSHCFRHGYRTWLDSLGTPVGIQRRLMRHADVCTTMNIYGDAGTPDMREAHGKIAGLALNDTGSGTERM